MKNPIVLVMLLLVSSKWCALAADPVENFAKDLLMRVDEQYWWGIQENKPAGGYLFKFEYDLNGDGRNETFVASSLEEDEGSYSWSIYSPNAQQIYTKIASGVVIPPIHGFYFKTSGSQRELQTVFKNSKFNLGVIDRYSVAITGNVTNTKQELTSEQVGQLDEDNWKETFSIGVEVKPTISKILLAEYTNDHAVQWRPYKTNLGVAEQNQDSADASAISSNKEFTLQKAKQLLPTP